MRLEYTMRKDYKEPTSEASREHRRDTREQKMGTQSKERTNPVPWKCSGALRTHSDGQCGKAHETVLTIGRCGICDRYGC